MSAETKNLTRRQYMGQLFSYNVKEAKKNWQLYLFMLPYMFAFFAFIVAPVVIAIYLGFTYFNVLEAPKFIGWDNYIRMMLADDIFLVGLKNTLLLAAITGPVGYILCLALAWMINELTPKLRAFMTLIFYAPAIANIYVIWKIIFSSDQFGLLNGFLMRWGFISGAVQWLEDPTYMKGVVILVLLWSSLGTSFLSLIAGLQGVDRSLYEAAAVDGISNRWQELWYVTLPFIKPHLMFAAVMSITGAFGIGGAITTLVGYPSQDYAVHTLMHHIEDYGNLRFEMGYACAISTFLFALQIVSNKLVQKFLSKVGE